jgi:hypothetical protein
MMLDVRVEYKRQTGSPKLYIPVSLIVGSCFVVEVALFLFGGFSSGFRRCVVYRLVHNFYR